jgi:hypothetical protein
MAQLRSGGEALFGPVAVRTPYFLSIGGPTVGGWAKSPLEDPFVATIDPGSQRASASKRSDSRCATAVPNGSRSAHPRDLPIPEFCEETATAKADQLSKRPSIFRLSTSVQPLFFSVLRRRSEPALLKSESFMPPPHRCSASPPQPSSSSPCAVCDALHHDKPGHGTALCGMVQS